MAGETVRVEGLKEFMRAVSKADKQTKKKIRERFKKVGEIVQRDAAVRFGGYDGRTAAGFRPVVRARGVAVEQRLRKTTGKHPEFGQLQMRRALVPALEANEEETVKELEKAIDDLADIVEGR